MDEEEADEDSGVRVIISTGQKSRDGSSEHEEEMGNLEVI